MSQRYEYKVVPAPRRPLRIRGVKGDEARFALAIEEAMNESAASGWEFLRSETLACEHRGWFRRSIERHTLLIYRRSKADAEIHTGAPIAPVRHSEPRLAAERGSVPRSGFASPRATPTADRGGERL